MILRETYPKDRTRMKKHPAGGKGSILVMSKVPIFRISKSKFLLSKNGKEYSSILLVSY